MNSIKFNLMNDSKKDEAKIVEWYGLAAEAGNSQAMDVMACYHANGLGGLKKDEEKAEYWYEKARELEKVSTLYNFAFYYGKASRNLIKDNGTKWYKKVVYAIRVFFIKKVVFCYAIIRDLIKNKVESLK